MIRNLIATGDRLQNGLKLGGSMILIVLRNDSSVEIITEKPSIDGSNLRSALKYGARPILQRLFTNSSTHLLGNCFHDYQERERLFFPANFELASWAAISA
jgi:hypothetical protein